MSEQNGNHQKELLQQRTRELQTLVRVAQLINVIDLDYVLLQTMQLMTEVANADKGSFFLLDEQQQPVQRFITQRNMPPEVSRKVAREVMEKGLGGWVVRHQQGTIVNDIRKDDRWYSFPDDDQDDVRSALCVPVMYEDMPRGIITLVSSAVNHFQESERELAEAVANQASTAIRNAQLFDSLQTKQKEMELILENNSEALLTVNEDLVITLFNPRAQNLLSDPTIDPIGQHLHEVDPHSIYTDVAERIQKTPPGTDAISFELRHKNPDSDFVIKVGALHSGDAPEARQNMRGYVITIHDVTSLRKYDRLKTNMLHILSHDLKNPLNIIWGYIDLLRVDSQTNLPADPRFVDGILRALQRMESLIEETLSAERLMSSGKDLSPKPFSPHELAKEALESLRQLATNKHHTIVEEIDPNIPDLMGMAFQVREAMVNLISNAIKYTPTNGTITIRAKIEDDTFRFEVKDTGLGIPKEMQQDIFTKFYRAHRPGTENIDGTGIGLTLVKDAIESHQGGVGFESQAGIGSTFSFWLPLPTHTTEA